MKKLLTVAFFSALFLAGCGEDNTGGGGQPQGEPSKVTISNQEFIVVAGTPTKSNGGVGGDVTIVAPKPYTWSHGIEYGLKLSLDDKGAFAVMTNGGQGLQRALTITIERDGNQFSRADAISGTGEKKSFLDKLNAQGLDLSKDLDLIIEIHNHAETEIFLHVIKDGQKKKVTGEGDLELEGEKSGGNWGFRLQGATLKSVTTKQSEHH